MKSYVSEVAKYVDGITESRKEDIIKLIQLGKAITGKEPHMWKDIIGFGNLHYRYPSGHEGDMPLFGIANRKQAMTLYVSYDIKQIPELKDLGKVSYGKGCLYIKRLSDIDFMILKKLIERATEDMMRLPFITDNEGKR